MSDRSFNMISPDLYDIKSEESNRYSNSQFDYEGNNYDNNVPNGTQKLEEPKNQNVTGYSNENTKDNTNEKNELNPKEKSGEINKVQENSFEDFLYQDDTINFQEVEIFFKNSFFGKKPDENEKNRIQEDLKFLDKDNTKCLKENGKKNFITCKIGEKIRSDNMRHKYEQIVFDSIKNGIESKYKDLNLENPDNEFIKKSFNSIREKEYKNISLKGLLIKANQNNLEILDKYNSNKELKEILNTLLKDYIDIFNGENIEDSCIMEKEKKNNEINLFADFKKLEDYHPFNKKTIKEKSIGKEVYSKFNEFHLHPKKKPKKKFKTRKIKENKKNNKIKKRKLFSIKRMEEKKE